MEKEMKEKPPVMHPVAVKPSLLYIFLGGIFLFFLIMFLTSCSKNEDPKPGLLINTFTPASGSAGTNVIITGAQFSSTAENNTVSFNDAPGIVVAATTTSLTVTVPPEATTGRIKVIVNGVSVTSTTDFTVVE